MAKQVVIVYQPTVANIFLVNGVIRERLIQHSPSVCLAFAAGYDLALGNKYECAAVAFCGDGDASEKEWKYTGTREMFSNIGGAQ